MWTLTVSRRSEMAPSTSASFLVAARGNALWWTPAWLLTGDPDRRWWRICSDALADAAHHGRLI